MVHAQLTIKQKLMLIILSLLRRVAQISKKYFHTSSSHAGFGFLLLALLFIDFAVEHLNSTNKNVVLSVDHPHFDESFFGSV